ncbi:hypothetical protein AB0I28_24585 [Phytomonospora sp. NPDC050363]|uniref:hypothetical protein n=1 Tax=Phytomonospora sp. NPDC050363 TaxID=3155642 RepID=UPI0033C6705E
MIEGAVRLNRFGLERGRLWSAVLLALAVFAPAVLWTQLDSAVDGDEGVAAGTVITLQASSNPGAAGKGSAWFTVPGDGWITETGSNRPSAVTLVHSPVVVRTSAIGGVDDILVLFERQARDLRMGDRVLFETGSRAYTTPTGLSGYWGDLTGERYSGALIVVGKGPVAAVIVAVAPLGRLEDQLNDITAILATLEVSDVA